MSILFNNGSGGVNQTNGYIPYNDNGQFKDSPFYYNKLTPTIESVNPVTNDSMGLYLEFINENFGFGDYNNATKGFAIFVNNFSEYIKTTVSGVSFGVNVQQNVTNIGDFDYNKQGTSLQVDDINQTIITYLEGNEQGIKIFHDTVGTSYEYYIGDFSAIHNNTNIAILDTSQTIDFRAATIMNSYTDTFRIQTNNLQYSEITGGSLLFTTAGGSSGKHLKIFINGVGYKIALLNL